MRIVVKGKEPIISLWRTPSKIPGRYRLMRYHVRTECEEGVALLNTVTGELVLLSEEEKEILDIFPLTYRPEMDELITHRFLVPESLDEMASVTQLRKVIRSLNFRINEVTGFTILPTTTCNARCFYCYESDYPRNSMSEETVLRTIEYIATHCGEAKRVTLSWFGGEPTLGEKSIDRICEGLNEKGIAFTSSMISNGYLFTREMAHKAREKWRLRNIQITLDGTEEVYNRVKAYVYAVGSPFQRVLDNIQLLLDEGIRVTVRMNLDSYNADNLKLLIDELAERFAKNERFSAYVHELFEGMGYEPVCRSIGELQDVLEEKQSIESYMDLVGLKQSVRTSLSRLPSLKMPYCMADNPGSVMINPEGGIGKCQHLQYTHLVGNLRDDSIVDQGELHYWLNYQPKEECGSCPLCPYCGVPNTCESGRVCIPGEVNRKLDALRDLCRNRINNNNG